MFGFPSSMDSAENKTFFVYRLFFAHHFPAGSIYWENLQRRLMKWTLFFPMAT